MFVCMRSCFCFLFSWEFDVLTGTPNIKYKVRGFSHKEDIKGKLGLGSDLGSDISSQNACWQRKVIKNGAI